MKERPILFKTEMVTAILENKKTQTRRVISSQPVNGNCKLMRLMESTDRDKNKKKGYFSWEELENEYSIKPNDDPIYFKCPYGENGDRLWVRETFCLNNGFIYFKADGIQLLPGNAKWKPSIFMQKIDSRITLEITNIRVERLNDISESDAIAEGIDWEDDYVHMRAKDAYESLWKKINGEESWKQNPWVWVIEFERINWYEA